MLSILSRPKFRHWQRVKNMCMVPKTNLTSLGVQSIFVTRVLLVKDKDSQEFIFICLSALPRDCMMNLLLACHAALILIFSFSS